MEEARNLKLDRTCRSMVCINLVPTYSCLVDEFSGFGHPEIVLLLNSFIPK